MGDQRRARLFAESLNDVVQAVGQPGVFAISWTSHAVAGVSSAAFSTAALPQISAGNSFHATLAIGVFAATIRPATPIGSRTVIACRFGTPLVVVRP